MDTLCAPFGMAVRLSLYVVGNRGPAHGAGRDLVSSVRRIVSDRRTSAPIVTTMLAAASGVVLGAFNGGAMSQSGLTAIPLLGTTTVVFVVVAIGASEVISLRAAWTRIAVRVAGSWIAATGLLLFGWSLRMHR